MNWRKTSLNKSQWPSFTPLAFSNITSASVLVLGLFKTTSSSSERVSSQPASPILKHALPSMFWITFTWMLWNASLQPWAFIKSSRGSPTISVHLQSLWDLCLLEQWYPTTDLEHYRTGTENFSMCQDSGETSWPWNVLALVMRVTNLQMENWLFFAQHAHNQESICQMTGRPILTSE